MMMMMMMMMRMHALFTPPTTLQLHSCLSRLNFTLHFLLICYPPFFFLGVRKGESHNQQPMTRFVATKN
ncbi:hypothetical protein ACJW30_08G091600 [Castanea mollissima]